MAKYESLHDYCLDDHFIVFPSGGLYNQLRATSKNSRYLDALFKQSQAGYNAAKSKKDFVRVQILDKIPGGLKLWRGKPGKGLLIPLNGDDAYLKVTQFMRDLRKRNLDQRSDSTSEVIQRATRQKLQPTRKAEPSKDPTDATESKVIPAAKKQCTKVAATESKATPAAKKQCTKVAATESKATPAAKKQCTKVAAKKKCAGNAKVGAPVRVNVGALKDELILSQKAELEALRGEFERQKETIRLQQERIAELESQILNMLVDNNNRIYLQQQQTHSTSIAAAVTPKDTNSTVDDKDEHDNETHVTHEGDERESDY